MTNTSCDPRGEAGFDIHALDVAGEPQGGVFGQAALWGHRAEQELGWLRIWEFGCACLHGRHLQQHRSVCRELASDRDTGKKEIGEQKGTVN